MFLLKGVSSRHWGLFVALCVLFVLRVLPAGAAAEGELKVLVSTYPIYQITRNVVQGRGCLKLSLMLPAQLGCPHDYMLSPRDLEKLAGADILILNGLGLEGFLGVALENLGPGVKVIEASAGISELLEDGGECCPSAGDGEGAHHEGHNPNPHLFASPLMSGRLALGIAAALAEIDPSGKELYSQNARIYSEKMDALAGQWRELVKALANRRIVQPHGVFDYLARDAGLRIVATLRAHGNEPSAAEMMAIVKEIKRSKAGAVFAEPQYPEKIGRTVAEEAGVAFAVLDPGASGPEDAPLDYYEVLMRKNMDLLKTALRGD
ncbi:MAG: zinc ABC transporter substrate-binding protein [Planctomycetes bacterium]|nr:zinc ABC transporter substrate-binding protein [Planctomycetota bacterium]